MKKILAVSCVALTLALPAHAGVNQGGSVLLPSATPGAAKAEFAAGRNGTTGFTFAIDPSRDGHPYTLTSLDGTTMLEDLDAWFYEDIPGPARGPGAICSTFDSDQSGRVESGTICPGAQTAEWVVVVLAVGANSTFVFQA